MGLIAKIMSKKQITIADKIKVIIFGNSVFTAIIVKKLLENKKLEITLVSYKNCPDYCVSNALQRFFKSEKFKYVDFDRGLDKEIEIIKREKYDVLISCAWGRKFSDEVLNLIDSYNLHSSMLPKYRGANPIQEQLANREKVSGVTMHLMSGEYDVGAIYKQKPFKIKQGMTLDDYCIKASHIMCDLLTSFFKEYPDITLVEQISQISYKGKTKNEI